MYYHFFVTSIFESLYFLKFLKNLALFDSYYWPFYKPHAKINAVLLISVIRVSIWKVFIKFPWHGEKPTSATLVTLSSISCHTVVMQSSGTHWDFLSKFLSLNYYTTLEGVLGVQRSRQAKGTIIYLVGLLFFSQSAIRLKKLTKIITIH